MEKIVIRSEIHNDESFDINGLKEIQTINDLASLGINSDLSNLSIIEYDNDIYALKIGNKIESYVKGKDKLSDLLSQVEETYNKEIETKLNLQSHEVAVKQNPRKKIEIGQDFVLANLDRYDLNLLYRMYKNAKAGKESYSKKILEAIFDKLNTMGNINEKLKFLDQIKDNNLYNKVVFNILKGIRTSDESDLLFNKVGKERLQEVLKNAVLIDDSFAEEYTYYFKSPNSVRGFSVSCGKGYNDEEACESFAAYVFAMTKKYNFQNIQVISKLVSKTFEGNLSYFKKDIASSIQTYKEIKGHLPDVAKKVLKEKGLIGLVKFGLGQTNMSPERQKFWSEVGVPLAAAGAAIYMIFKFIKANGFKGLLGLLIGEVAFEAASGETMFSAFSKLLYGGLDTFGDGTKKGAKDSMNKKEYAEELGFPMFTLFMMGDFKIEKLKSEGIISFDNGKTKFDVNKFISNLDPSDERRIFLEDMIRKQGKDKVNKMFSKAFDKMGLNVHTYNKWYNKKVSDLYQNLLKELPKKKNKPKTSVPPVSPVGHTDTKPSSTGKENTVETTNDDVEVSHGKEVVVFTSKGKSSLPAHTEIQDENVYSFRNLSELEQRVREELKKKLGEALYKKFNEKLKLLSNLQVFMNYMKIYASINNDEDLGTFGYGSNFYDEMPIFIKGAVFPSYDRLFGSLIKLAKEGKKKELELLLNKLDDKSVLSTLENIDGQMIKDYDFFFWKHKEDTPLDTEKERNDLLNMLKKGDKFDIEKFFLDKMKTPDFVQSDVISNTQIIGLDLNILSDGSLDQAVNEVYSKLNKLSIYGKKVSLNVDKDDLKDILEDLREDTAQMGKDQRMRYIYSMLVGKILNDNEDTVLNSVSGDIKKKLKTYYDTVGPWDSFKQRWQSTIMKGIPIMGAVILTDGIVAGVLPEGAMLGWGGARFIARVATMQNVAGDMSLLLNDQLTGKNALKVAGNLEGYMHTAAYMAVFEIFAVANKTIGQTKTFQKIGGTLEKVGGKTINLKNASIYGLNVGGILTIDTVIFDGEFTAEELMNALIFGFLAFHGGNFKVFKKNGKINIEEIKAIKARGEEVKDKLKAKKEGLEQDRDVIEQDIDTINQVKKQRQQELQDLRNDLSLKESELTAKKTELTIKEKELQDLYKQKDLVFNKLKRLLDVIKKSISDPRSALNTFFRNPSREFKDFWNNKKAVDKLIQDLENGHYYRIISDPNVPMEIKTTVREYNDILSDITRIEGERSRIETDIQAKESEINTIDVQISLRNSEIARLNREIQRKETSIGRVDKRVQRKIEGYLYENYYKDLFLSEIESKVKAKEKAEYDLGNGIKVKINEKGEIILSDNGNVLKFKKFKKFQEEYSNIESRIDKSKIVSLKNKEIYEDISNNIKDVEYNIELTDGFYMPKNERIVKLGKEKYSILKKGDEFYLVEKVKKGGKETYEIDKAKKIDDFIRENPEYLEEVYHQSMAGLEKLFKDKGLWDKPILKSINTKSLTNIFGKQIPGLNKLQGMSVGEFITEFKNSKGFIKSTHLVFKWLLTGKKPAENMWVGAGDYLLAIPAGLIVLGLWSGTTESLNNYFIKKEGVLTSIMTGFGKGLREPFSKSGDLLKDITHGDFEKIDLGFILDYLVYSRLGFVGQLGYTGADYYFADKPEAGYNE